ncbi:MAG: DUF1385 domain-containing protein [Clostridia bacterium]|nr:DUF1385 domain-containing protein [Clostridia bacterium]
MAKKEINPRLGKTGGQAVLEGVMMRTGEKYATAVRNVNGDISVKEGSFVSLRKKSKIANFPLIRGVVSFVESMIFSYKTLSESVELSGIGDSAEPESKFDKWLTEKFGDKLMQVVTVIGTVLGVVLAVALFILVPTAITALIEKLTGTELGIWKNVISGVIKIIIFILYMLIVSLQKDIRRVFEYHGAEHKTIFCYENNEPLTVENVKKNRRFHPRCGTSFIFVILLIGIMVSVIANFFVNTWSSVPLQFLTKLILLPIVVGIGFEFLMYAGKHDNLFTRICSAPGLWMQRITTKEPDDGQIECAIEALFRSLPEDEAQAEREKAGLAADDISDAEKENQE